MQTRVQALTSLTLSRIPWDTVSDEWAAKIPGDDPTANSSYLAEEVRTGRATHHALFHDGKRCGLIITRVESGANCRELLILAAYVVPGNPNSTDDPAPFLAIAEAENCASIRIHTLRPALVKKLTQKHGFRLCEIVLRKSL